MGPLPPHKAADRVEEYSLSTARPFPRPQVGTKVRGQCVLKSNDLERLWTEQRIRGGGPSGGHRSAPRKDRRLGGHSSRVPIPGHAPVVRLLTCSVSPKDSLWMTWVMSGFWGWAEALCVDTWKLPGTWGER